MCSEGALRVKCNTTADLLEWSVTDPSNQRNVTRAFQSDDRRMTTTSISVNSTTLNISRSPPLVSTIFTDNTTAGFNRSVITCSEQTENGKTLSSASVQIILVGNNGGNVNSKLIKNCTPSRMCILSILHDFNTCSYSAYKHLSVV